MATTTMGTTTYGSTPRTQRLRAKRIYPGVAAEAVEFTKEQRTPGQLDYLRGIKTHLRTFSKICPERARLLTEAYRESEGQPEVIRRAKAVANILDNMTIYIENDELIVGNYASSPGALPTFPEWDYTWLDTAISSGGFYAQRVSNEEAKDLQEIHAYWKGKSFRDRVLAALPPDLAEWMGFSGPLYIDTFIEGAAHGHKRLLQIGQNGIIKMCQDKLEEVRQQGVKGKTAREYLDQIANLEAMIIANEAFGRFGQRYAKLAREMAEKESNAARRKELEKIAEVCDWVPANPPRNFWEALQSLFFSHIVRSAIEYFGTGSGTRFDTVMCPFYKKDKEEGRITRDEAVELLECLWVKMEGISSLRPPEGELVSVGSSQFQTFTLGGVDEKGKDATNEMSYMCLDASMNIRTIQPTLVIRYHPKIDPGFIDRAIDLLHTGIGFPSFNSDSQAIPILLRRGVPPDEVWDWTVGGCVQWLMPDKNQGLGPALVGFLSVGKCLDLALNDGYCRFLGRQLGPHTGDPRKFRSIEDFKEAYLKQVNFFVDKMVQIHHIEEELKRAYLKRPLVSAHLDGCIEQGKDGRDFVPYNGWAVENNIKVAGMINVADSLTAIKKLVFDDKVVTIEGLLEAVCNDWEGKEDLRQECLNVPKYGNDDDYADEMAQWVHYATQAEVRKFKCYSGTELWIEGSVISAYYALGRFCPATPDGRKDSQPFADGTGSPTAGADTHGPTATLCSLGKIDTQRAHGMLFNQKFMPQSLEGENKKLFAHYLRTWYDLGIYHVQFNVVDRDVLLDAQAHPEKYPDLVVRVAGYSAYWADLGKPLQDDIIKRTEQCFA